MKKSARSGPVPENFDWSNADGQDFLEPVMDQGDCGSCWTFSAVGALEGALAIATGKPVQLSEQELVSCDKTDQGCDGGAMENAFKYLEENPMCTEQAYPYIGKVDTCKLDGCSGADVAVKKGQVTGFVSVPQDDPEAMMSALAKGPVAVAIEADTMIFQFYGGGVLTNYFGDCGSTLDHGVLAVGYGSDPEATGLDYWKVKNSWGADWGEDGYIRMQRTEKKDAGMCGILMDGSYPVLDISVAADGRIGALQSFAKRVTSSAQFLQK